MKWNMKFKIGAYSRFVTFRSTFVKATDKAGNSYWLNEEKRKNLLTFYCSITFYDYIFWHGSNISLLLIISPMKNELYTLYTCMYWMVRYYYGL